MKKHVLILLMLCIQHWALAQRKQVYINSHLFEIETRENEDGMKATAIYLYKNNKQILMHTIYNETGDCSSVSVELGKYEIKNNSIIFYTYWATADRMPAFVVPYGFRKQVYTLDTHGKMQLTKGEIYIEDYVQKNSENQMYYAENEEWRHDGLQYLIDKPKNSLAKNALKNYKENIEKKYHAKFAKGKEKQALEATVRKILKKEIAENTSQWTPGEIYGNVKK